MKKRASGFLLSDFLTFAIVFVMNPGSAGMAVRYL